MDFVWHQCSNCRVAGASSSSSSVVSVVFVVVVAAAATITIHPDIAFIFFLFIQFIYQTSVSYLMFFKFYFLICDILYVHILQWTLLTYTNKFENIKFQTNHPLCTYPILCFALLHSALWMITKIQLFT